MVQIVVRKGGGKEGKREEVKEKEGCEVKGEKGERERKGGKVGGCAGSFQNCTKLIRIKASHITLKYFINQAKFATKMMIYIFLDHQQIHNRGFFSI